jgi:hypothetical protein
MCIGPTNLQGSPRRSGDPNIEIARDIGRFAYDPLKHAMYAFPWGEPESPLEQVSGPRTWQRGVKEVIRDHLANPKPVTSRA